MPGGPKWYELFLILYRTPYSTKIKVNITDVVTMSFKNLYFRVDYPKPVTVAKHLNIWLF